MCSQGLSNTKYLPTVNVTAHATIFSTASKTVLSQTFVNSSSTLELDECIYVFPLYDLVSVVGFKCQIGSRTIHGVVKEKTKAKEVYNDAIARGKTAGLLEQGPTSDVFMTTLGNIPAGEKFLVTLTYIGELKHDVGADGIRFILPTMISPRYGRYEIVASTCDSNVPAGNITITVDIMMAKDSHLQEVRSPSHPIAVTLGRTSIDSMKLSCMSRASANLCLGNCYLEKDFILEIMHQDSGKPMALLETHQDIPNQPALMTTLVPRIPTQTSKPEVIFVADQSGSMAGSRTQTLVAALKVFLKSLPVGIKFNICLFGTSHTFLFPKSQSYGQNSLRRAHDILSGLGGHYGGTETLAAVKASVESRDPNQPLSLILATDGDIWQQKEFLDYINQSISASEKALRMFALGIGNSVSSALIEGVARAGNGFACSVGEGEKLDGKAIRMLRGALSPDNGLYTIEFQYQKGEDEDFVLVEKVNDSLRIIRIDDDTPSDIQLDRKLRESLLVTTQDSEDTDIVALPDADGQARYTNLPFLLEPKLMQTPQHIPPLYPFSRTTIYIMMSPEAAEGTPTSVILRGASKENPFEMEIPIDVIEQPGTTIHQLAAKKAVTELEEGRGWLVHAKDDNGIFIKRYSNCFESMVEREAIRLGVRYQIAGKCTPFVAIESNSEESDSPQSKVGRPQETTGASPSTAPSDQNAHRNRQSTRRQSPYMQLVSGAAS